MTDPDHVDPEPEIALFETAAMVVDANARSTPTWMLSPIIHQLLHAGGHSFSQWRIEEAIDIVRSLEAAPDSAAAKAALERAPGLKQALDERSRSSSYTPAAFGVVGQDKERQP
jgi:hypothetical protein